MTERPYLFRVLFSTTTSNTSTHWHKAENKRDLDDPRLVQLSRERRLGAGELARARFRDLVILGLPPAAVHGRRGRGLVLVAGVPACVEIKFQAPSTRH